MRPCDEPRATPDWVPQAAPCPVCQSREWGHSHNDLDIPGNIELGTE